MPSASTLMVLMFLSQMCLAQKSQCYGDVGQGRLRDGVQLAPSGVNFVGYAPAGHYLGRTFVHSEVKRIVMSAYDALVISDPDVKFMYAETGFAHGGPFAPHKTHQNGLSVDFMVPVKNGRNESVLLPSTLANKFGYGIEFDALGRYQNFIIDNEAMTAHIVALDEAAKKLGYKIKKIIFDPELQKSLFHNSSGKKSIQQMPFSNHSVWVRHDEHYHVDFDVPCLPYEDWAVEQGS